MTSLPEGRAPESSKPKITQLIYFAALAGLVIYLLYVFTRQFFYFVEIGYVEVEKITISSARGGRISALKVSPGEKLERGATLAVIENHRECLEQEDNRLEKLRFDIGADRAQLDFVTVQIEQNNQTADTHTLRRALELERGILSEQNQLQRANLVLMNEADLLTQQIELKKQRLQRLENQRASVLLPQECYDETLSAPFASSVYVMQKNAYEVVSRAESILTLVADNAPVRIEVYLDMDDLASVEIGDEVALEFPGAVKSTGVIESIFSSAYDTPGRLWDHYRPLEPQVRVHLQPIDEQQTMLWKSFDRMEVQVRGQK